MAQPENNRTLDKIIAAQNAVHDAIDRLDAIIEPSRRAFDKLLMDSLQKADDRAEAPQEGAR